MIKDAHNCPNDANNVASGSGDWCEAGTNSMNMVLSTYWFPPIANPIIAAKMAIAAKLGEPAARSAVMQLRPSVMFQAGRRPI